MNSFSHHQTAHCESGAISNLLRNAGLNISEPMAFGISGALTFAYLPIIKVGGLPLLAYRMPPGRVIKGLSKRIGVDIKMERFRNAELGMQKLDEHLNSGRPVGLQTSVFWLPYFPEDMRFHFNAHNLIAYRYEQRDCSNEKTYFISDPTFENPVTVDQKSLQRARFVKGMLAPKGLIYYPESVPDYIDLKKPIKQAIIANSNMMLKTPLPIVGVRGIRYVSKTLLRLGQSSNKDNYGKQFIGHMVRMQEEIGTGGAGFRFLYASFLQEAAGILENTKLNDVSKDFTDAGDEWRRYALYVAKMLKGRMELDFTTLSDQLIKVSEMEKSAFLKLRESI